MSDSNTAEALGPTPLTTQIALAAVTAAGPVGDDEIAWHERVADLAGKITQDLVSPFSPVRKSIEAITNADKKFVCVIERVQREKSSTRALVTVKARKSTYSPDGQETFRTDRTAGDAHALALAKYLTSLKGHKVLAYLAMEKTRDGRRSASSRRSPISVRPPATSSRTRPPDLTIPARGHGAPNAGPGATLRMVPVDGQRNAPAMSESGDRWGYPASAHRSEAAPGARKGDRRGRGRSAGGTGPGGAGAAHVRAGHQPSHHPADRP